MWLCRRWVLDHCLYDDTMTSAQRIPLPRHGSGPGLGFSLWRVGRGPKGSKEEGEVPGRDSMAVGPRAGVAKEQCVRAELTLFSPAAGRDV